jgi:hypothetical protein
MAAARVVTPVLPLQTIKLQSINADRIYPFRRPSSSITKGFAHIMCPRTDAGAETFFDPIPLTYEGYNFSVTFELLLEYRWVDNTIRIKFSFEGLDGMFDVNGTQAYLTNVGWLVTESGYVMLWEGAGLPYYSESMWDRIRDYDRSRSELAWRDVGLWKATMYNRDPYSCSHWRKIVVGRIPTCFVPEEHPVALSTDPLLVRIAELEAQLAALTADGRIHRRIN